MNKINFTYNNIREELKQCFLEKPFSCTYGWIINWINLEISKFCFFIRLMSLFHIIVIHNNVNIVITSKPLILVSIVISIILINFFKKQMIFDIHSKLFVI